MSWYHWLALVSLVICLASLLFQLLRLIRSGSPKDFSSPRGDVLSGVTYSFTGAMSPLKKESAFLHLPTYTAGILYHLGTFTGILLFFLNLFQVKLSAPFTMIIGIFLFITGISGLGILLKRSFQPALRHLSNPDDYFSNLLVSGFQLISALSLFIPDLLPVYFVWISVLLLYIPAGKLKHLLYFFAARYHLGFFYGWRGVWPPKKF